MVSVSAGLKFNFRFYYFMLLFNSKERFSLPDVLYIYTPLIFLLQIGLGIINLVTFIVNIVFYIGLD